MEILGILRVATSAAPTRSCWNVGWRTVRSAKTAPEKNYWPGGPISARERVDAATPENAGVVIADDSQPKLAYWALVIETTRSSTPRPSNQKRCKLIDFAHARPDRGPRHCN